MSSPAAVTRRALRPLMRPGLRRALPPVRWAWDALGRRAELGFWRTRPDLIGDGEREWTFTECFGIEREWYRDKRVLDVGCGPRGSLDWAAHASARVGLDPLADSYLELGADGTAMDYVTGVAERMPFADASFDLVASFNSLDHVQDLPRAAAEIARVLRPGGLFLLATELGHGPRLTEPQTFGWEVTRAFEPALAVVEERRYEDSGEGIDKSLRDAIAYDDPSGRRPGVLAATLRRG